ncbi:hypothetical protein [Komagataeibacter saccharivorans]|uniref:hypothetical protein n=1 Tax=Komagataeibacter saccharivorans TaxID=265959 RepID=UPI0039E8B373
MSTIPSEVVEAGARALCESYNDPLGPDAMVETIRGGAQVPNWQTYRRAAVNVLIAATYAAKGLKPHPLSDQNHPCLRGLRFGREIYDVEIHGDGTGEYLGQVVESDSPCRIVFRGLLVREGGCRLIRARGVQAWLTEGKGTDASS